MKVRCCLHASVYESVLSDHPSKYEALPYITIGDAGGAAHSSDGTFINASVKAADGSSQNIPAVWTLPEMLL